jgi:hypothetical protein
MGAVQQKITPSEANFDLERAGRIQEGLQCSAVAAVGQSQGSEKREIYPPAREQV